MTEQEYFAHPAVSNSFLGQIWGQMHGAEPNPITEKNSTFGRRFHTATLESHLYEPQFDKDEHTIMAMAKSAKINVGFLYAITRLECQIEKPVFFEYCGVQCKIKPDAKWGKVVWDLKSTAATSMAQFLESMDKYDYWRQAHLYSVGAQSERFNFLGVSKSAPHRTFVIDIRDFPEKMAEAKIKTEQILNFYKQLTNE